MIGDNANIKQKKKKRVKWFIRILVFLLAFIVILAFLLASLLYIPSVQNYAADKVVGNFSKKINGEVSIGNVKLNIFKGFVLEDFVIVDKLSGDTIISAATANGSLKDNLLSLRNKQADFSTIELGGVSIADVRGAESTFSKLATLFSQSEKNQENNKNKQQDPFLLNLEEVLLKDFEYTFVDSIKGEKRFIHLKQASILVDSIDLAKQDFYISSLESNEPIFNLTFFEKSDYRFKSSSVVISDSTYVIPDTFDLYIANAKLTDGKFELHDENKIASRIPRSFDPANILTKEIDLEIADFYANSFVEIEAKITSGKLKSSDNIIHIREFACDKFELGKRRMTFSDLELVTKNSRIKDRLVFKFRNIKDFNDFNNKVIMEGNINRSLVGIDELIYFAPGMKRSTFFNENRDRQISLDGHVVGRVNSLNANEMSIKLGDEITLNGRMNSRNLSEVDNALLNLDLDEFSVTVATLSELIPGFTAPANFYKLGRLKFDGRFDGYFQDFVAFGDLSSDLGKADLDMRLDLKEGAENAQYSGRAVLKEFDLATWSGNDDFGIIEVEAEVKDGKGLRIESVNADLAANVNVLEYKDYIYEDFRMVGQFEKNLFDGTFVISDPNIDLDFSGTVDFTDSIPVYDFKAEVNSLKLKELNIIEEDFALHGNLTINANGTDVDNAQGTASGSDFILIKNGNEFKLDSFDLKARGAFPERRNFVLNSSLADVELNGIFKLEELPDAFISGLKTNYPNFTKQLTHFKYEEPTPGYDFNINMSIRESEDIFEVLLGQSLFIRDAKVLGRISDVENRSALDVSFPFVEYNGNVFGGITGDLFAQADRGKLKMLVEYANINNVEFLPVELLAEAGKEELNFTINSAELLDSFTDIEIVGSLRTLSDRFKVRLDNTQFEAFGSVWQFNQSNSVTFGNEYIKIDNLNLSDGERELSFNDINNKGVALNITALQSSFFNRLLSADLRGDINGSVKVDDIFDFNGLNAALNIPSFGFRSHEFGKVEFLANSLSFDDPVSYTLTANDEEKSIEMKGSYLLKSKENSGSLLVNDYPLDLLEYIITDGISGTTGQFDASLSYFGPIAFPEISGNATVKEGGSKVDYLGTRYEIGENDIKFSKGYIDFSNGILLDSEGQRAIVQGGLRHEAFRNFAADLRIRSPKFIALNTTKVDNPSYYGFAQGEIDVSFDGYFETILITVNATTGRNTVLYLPVEYTAEEYSTDFIEIINKDAPRKQVSREDIDLKGLSLDMNVNVTEDAKVDILFDEKAKDILESQGRGPIRLSIDPEGNFEMFGKYEVVSGQYLFTIPSLYVNKSFLIQNGGSIEWTGDPLNATLDIDATYRGLQASLTEFLSEYLPQDVNSNLYNQARQRTEVSLTMDLGGTMSTPDIDFDISFPNLTGELKPLADGRLRTLESNQDAYNEQVFGLILLRTFLPPNQVGNNIINSRNLIGTTYSTISEFVSNQFSIVLSSIFDEALKGNSYFSGIDVNFAANENALGIQNAGLFNLPDEYDINIISSFNENKWNVQLGGRYVVNGVFNQNEYFAPDFVVEYYITDDRRLKLNLYARSDYDASNLRKLQSGIGISYRKEFNSLFDFARQINEETQQLGTN